MVIFILQLKIHRERRPVLFPRVPIVSYNYSMLLEFSKCDEIKVNVGENLALMFSKRKLKTVFQKYFLLENIYINNGN